MFEYNKTSDINFTRDYLYQEYEEDVQPISEVSYTHFKADYNYSLYARKRTNRFYSEVERLPEFKYNITSLKLGDSGFYYRNELALANLNKKTANSAQDVDVNRIDDYNELKYPTKLPGSMDWINFTPYLGMRQTYYTKDKDGDLEDLVRGIHYYGAETTTRFFKTSNFSGDFFGVKFNRLRHVVSPSIKYTYIHNPTIPGQKWGNFDAIDNIAKTYFFTLGIENQLQTKWNIVDSLEKESVDVIYFYPSIDYFHRVVFGQRHFSNIRADLDITPNRWLEFESDMAYNQYQRRFQTANVDIWASGLDDKWRAGIGKRYDRDISEQMTGDFYYEINRTWQARVYGRYESYVGHFQELQYTIYRDLHCWLLELTYNMELEDDGSTRDRAFWFVFRLKAFPEQSPVQMSVGYDTANSFRNRK